MRLQDSVFLKFAGTERRHFWKLRVKSRQCFRASIRATLWVWA